MKHDYRDMATDRRNSRAPIDPSPTFLLVLTGLGWGAVFWFCMAGQSGIWQ